MPRSELTPLPEHFRELYDNQLTEYQLAHSKAERRLDEAKQLRDRMVVLVKDLEDELTTLDFKIKMLKADIADEF